MAKTKLRLNLDHLDVDSFVTHPERDGVRGTVEGHSLEPVPTTFDLGKYTQLCTAGCPGGTLVCNEPVDPNEKYRLPNLD
jgi:hypothetical protein